MKIVYFGYDFFYNCLDFLVKNNFEIFKVYSYKTDNNYNFNTYIQNICNKNNIPFTTNKIDYNELKYLEDNDVDLIISAAYPYKIPISKIIKGINIHPTLLPIGRGPWPLPYIILKEYSESGVTIHKLIDKLDAGDILIQKKFKVNRDDNLETISIKSQLLARQALEILLKNFEYFWINAKPQSGGSYWKMPTEEDMLLDWNKPVSYIEKVARAFGKMDSVAFFDNKHWIVQDVKVWEENHNIPIGKVVHKTNKEVLIAAINGFVCCRYFKKDLDYE